MSCQRQEASTPNMGSNLHHPPGMYCALRGDVPFADAVVMWLQGHGWQREAIEEARKYRKELSENWKWVADLPLPEEIGSKMTPRNKP